jgi:hypothetical protein
MATAGKPSGTVIQALRHIGRDNVNDEVIGRIKTVLSDDDKAALKKDVDNAPDWMRPILTTLAS